MWVTGDHCDSAKQYATKHPEIKREKGMWVRVRIMTPHMCTDIAPGDRVSMKQMRELRDLASMRRLELVGYDGRCIESITTLADRLLEGVSLPSSHPPVASPQPQSMGFQRW